MIDTIKIEDIIKEKVAGAFDYNMIKVEEGSFIMGDNNSLNGDEKPVHEVTLPTFYISQYPVTNIQYAIFLNDIGFNEITLANKEEHTFIHSYSSGLQQNGARWYTEKGFKNHPIIAVSWYGAMEYCKWLSKKTSNNYRLPSEAEWEFAARGGNKNLGFKYAGSHKLKEVGWFRGNSYSETKPVGLKLPNELGLYDMSGNVWEWCADNWHKNYENALSDGSVWLENGDKSRRVVRGGPWDYGGNYCRVYSRDWFNVNDWSRFIGFRFARY